MNALAICILALAQGDSQEPQPLPPNQPGRTELRVETPTRSPLTLKESPFAVTVIDQEQIDLRRTDTTTDLLREQPGLHMVLQGTRGFITSVFMRGTDSAHTLVLLDGFKMNQDGDTFNQYELLTPRGLGSIEIFRGPGSAVYGSSAAGGVINMITEQGEGAPRASAGAEYGTFGTNLEHVRVIGRVDQLSFHVIGSRTDQPDVGIPNSAFRNQNLAGRADYQLAQRASIKVIARYVDSHTDIYSNDAGPRLSPLDPDAFLDDEVILLGVEGTFGPTEYLDVVLRHGYFKKHQFSSDVATPGDGDFGPFISSALFYRHNTDAIVNLRLGKIDTISAGYEHQFERFDNETNFGATVQHRGDDAFFAQNELRLLESIVIVGGARFERNEFFGDETTGRVGGAYFVAATSTKVRASWGTAITAPSFFDLFGFGGNPNLKPERVETVDGGFDQWFLNDTVRVSATGFDNHIRNLILFSGGAVKNIGRAHTWGAEFEAECRVPGVEGLTIRIAYTLLETFDASTGRPLIRRPEHSGKIGGAYRTETLGLSIDVGLVGDRPDLNFAGFPAVRETVPGFVKIDVSAYVRIWKDVRLTARVDNAFDAVYQETRGFTGAEMTALFGIEVGLTAPELGIAK